MNAGTRLYHRGIIVVKILGLCSEQLFKIFMGKEAKRIEIIQNKEDKEKIPCTLPPFLISFFLIFLSEDFKKGRAARFAKGQIYDSDR